MTYATNNPPVLMVRSRDGSSPNMWVYASSDVHTDVDAAGYISNATNLGMRVGDIVYVQETDNSYATTLHSVASISSGAATLSTAILS